jgi:hypothetical protein
MEILIANAPIKTQRKLLKTKLGTNPNSAFSRVFPGCRFPKRFPEIDPAKMPAYTCLSGSTPKEQPSWNNQSS